MTGAMIANGPLQVKGLTLTQRVLQSPMAGCTDLAYRRIARDFGCDLAFCEMVRAEAVVRGDKGTLALVRTAEWDHPLGMQLFGRDPDLMSRAARRLQDLGADVIDVNLGCPVPKIVKSGCGSALLREPDQVGRIIEAMARAVSIPVTIKMRTGFEEGDDGRFLDVVRIACEAGVGAITVHGRTRDQRMRGDANHSAIRLAKEASSVPVIGNGNVYSGEDAEQMLEETGCDGVMLARGALGNPWIFRDIANYLAGLPAAPQPTPLDRAEVLRRHFELMVPLYDEYGALLRIRRVCAWFITGIAGSADMRRRACLVETREAFHALVDEFASGAPVRETSPSVPAHAREDRDTLPAGSR